MVFNCGRSDLLSASKQLDGTKSLEFERKNWTAGT